MTTLIWHGRTYQVDNRGELGLYVGAARTQKRQMKPTRFVGCRA